MSFLAALTRTVQKSSLFLSCFFFSLLFTLIKFPTYIVMHSSIVMIGFSCTFPICIRQLPAQKLSDNGNEELIRRKNFINDNYGPYLLSF